MELRVFFAVCRSSHLAVLDPPAQPKTKAFWEKKDLKPAAIVVLAVLTKRIGFPFLQSSFLVVFVHLMPGP